MRHVDHLCMLSYLAELQADVVLGERARRRFRRGDVPELRKLQPELERIVPEVVSLLAELQSLLFERQSVHLEIQQVLAEIRENERPSEARP